VVACSSPLAPASSICATSVTFTARYTMAVNNQLDLIFVIDDSAAMAGWQAQLATQLANLATIAQDSPTPVDLHLGVISSDMGVGAAANASLLGCSAGGDGGALRSQPEASCTATTLDSGATFISNTPPNPGPTFVSTTGPTRNFSAPDDASGPGAAKVFQCIGELGADGCGFGQPLAALERALGADGQPPPAANAGFLRPDAYLGIVIISGEDDCSAPAASSLFSSAGSGDGPLTHYRCNHAGHLCQDPQASQRVIAPPLDPPGDATVVDGVPTLSLVDCVSNDDGELTPVSKLIADIKALKADPENQILVSTVVGPATPYAVEWPTGAPAAQVAPSCGTRNADGSGAYGEPGVRLSQFANAFPNSILLSICDPSYGSALSYLGRGQETGTPPCLPADIQTRTDAQGNSFPDCVATDHLVNAGDAQDISIPPCLGPPGKTACWTLTQGAGSCSGQSLTVYNAPVGTDPANESASLEISCQLAPPSPPADAGACPG